MTVPNNYGRTTWNFTCANGASAAVVQHFFETLNQDLTSQMLQDVAGTLEDWWTNSIGGQIGRAFFNQNTTLRSIVCTAFRQNPQLQEELIVGTAGTATGVSSPSEGAVVVSWYTAAAGRSYRGRSFWPGYDPDTLGNDGQLTAAQATSWTGTMNTLISQYELTASINMAVYSRKLDQMTEVLTPVVRRTIHHQSRRNS